MSKHDQLLAAMISGYATQAMAGLGKIANPLTGNVERDLAQARAMIELLEMLEVKTEGNRDAETSSFLRQTLSMLRLNYVDEAGKKDESPANADAEPTTTPSQGSSGEAGAPAE
jgi:hypothetical protein